MKTILCFSPKVPTRSGGGASHRLATVLAHLRSLGHTVHFVLVSRSGSDLRKHDLSPFVDSARHLPLHTASGEAAGQNARLARRLKCSRSAVAKSMHAAVNFMLGRRSLEAEVAGLLARHDPDLVWVDNSFIAPLFTPHRPGSRATWVVDTIDVLHLRDETLRAAGLPSECDVSRDDEAKLLAAFDLVIAIQSNEANVLRQMLPDRRVITVGHAINPLASLATRPSVLFVGSSGTPNVQGVCAFLDEAWGAILKRCPEARLEIVGKAGKIGAVRDAAKRFGASVELRGQLPDIAAAYEGPAVVVCPVWVGSGLKIKIVEALAFGKAAVATPLGAAGLEDGFGRAFEVVERAADFVEPVAELLRNPARRRELEQSALDYAEQHFSPRAIYAELDVELSASAPRTRCA